MVLLPPFYIQMINQKTIEQMIAECPNKNQWCFLRELMHHIGLSDRQCIQIRLVYDYKLIQSSKEKQDIGEKRAIEEFIEKHAERYYNIYTEGITYEECRYKLFVEEKNG